MQVEVYPQSLYIPRKFVQLNFVSVDSNVIWDNVTGEMCVLMKFTYN